MTMQHAAEVPTPELDKQRKIIDAGRNENIGEFLDWLQSNYVIARWVKDDDEQDQLLPTWASPSRLMAEYFEIDLDKVEREKRALLDAIRQEEG